MKLVENENPNWRRRRQDRVHTRRIRVESSRVGSDPIRSGSTATWVLVLVWSGLVWPGLSSSLIFAVSFCVQGFIIPQPLVVVVTDCPQDFCFDRIPSAFFFFFLSFTSSLDDIHTGFNWPISLSLS